MPARMPTQTAALSTIACAIALLLAAPPPVSAEVRGSDHDATAFDVQARHQRHHRSHGAERDSRPPAYGPPALVRAYLPRNHAVPMYNEPPAR